MIEQQEMKRLTTGNIFKLLLLGTSCSIIPFSLVMGILSIFGASTVTWNDQPLTGVTGLIASPFIGAFIALLLSGIFGLFIALGLWFYSRFKPLTVQYWCVDSQAESKVTT